MTPTPREQRGMIIAATSRIKRKAGNLWTVPSQQSATGQSPYEENLHVS
jgi:hypothetical protein